MCCVHAEALKCKPGHEGYEEELASACDAFTEQLADAVKGVYERHRHNVPGWEARPLIVH